MRGYGDRFWVGEEVVWETGTGFGAHRGEIPAASAGMTDLFCAGVADLFVRVWRILLVRVWRRWDAGTGLGAERGGIPAASAGMTDLFCVGVAEVGGGYGAWRPPRRDTRGKRGYDGSFCAGVGIDFA